MLAGICESRLGDSVAIPAIPRDLGDH